jgi:hypothetical protein
VSAINRNTCPQSPESAAGLPRLPDRRLGLALVSTIGSDGAIHSAASSEGFLLRRLHVADAAFENLRTKRNDDYTNETTRLHKRPAKPLKSGGTFAGSGAPNLTGSEQANTCRKQAGKARHWTSRRQPPRRPKNGGGCSDIMRRAVPGDSVHPRPRIIGPGEPVPPIQQLDDE